MPTNTYGRMANILATVSPSWAVAFLRWQQRGERARQRLERMRTAETSAPIEPEPSQPRDIDSIWNRLNSSRR
jgi:hypothetical protein